MHAERLMPPKVAVDGYKGHCVVSKPNIRERGLQMSLIELVKMEASQIKGCTFCLDSHSKDARKAGEREQRLYLLTSWRESLLYTLAERAALAWTDALTLVSKTHAPDDAYEALRPHFSDKQIVDLTILIGQINLWNRVAIGMRYVHDVDPAPSGR